MPANCRDLGALPEPTSAKETTALAGKACHRYRFSLSAGDLLSLTVEQDEVDVEVSLVDPKGDALLTVDLPTGPFGGEKVLAIAERSGEHLLTLRSFPQEEPGRYVLRLDAKGSASPEERELAVAYRRALEAEQQPAKEQLQTWSEVAKLFAARNAHRLAGEAWFRAAWLHASNDPERAEGFRRASRSLGRAQELGWQALAEQNLCSALIERSRAEEALAACERAEVHSAHADRLTRAGVAHGAGVAYRMLGELQPALDQLEKALTLWPSDDTALRPATLHEIGVLQARFLGDEAAGAKRLREALAVMRSRTDSALPGALRGALARSASSQLGRLAYERGDLEEARSHFEQSLALTGDPCRRSTALSRLALVEAKQGREEEASRHAAEASERVEDAQCPRFEGTVHLLVGELAEIRFDWAAARGAFRRAEAHFERWGDQPGAAESLAGMARAERALGFPGKALVAAEGALARAEGVRPTVLRLDLRTTFSSSVQEIYDLVIDLLLDLGRPGDAWAMAERTRARGLRDLLVESGVGLRRGTDPALIEREQSLRRHLNSLESRRTNTDRSLDEDELAILSEQVANALADLETVRGELRRTSPEYAGGAGFAELVATAPPSPEDLQRMISPDATLLELHLAEDRSVLWTVTSESIHAHRLPPRGEIEPLAAEVAAWMRRTGGSGRPPPAACQLSNTVLGSLAFEDLAPRLIVVADGALETVSFAALPQPHFPGPCGEAPPLIASHEISYLPSATVLAEVRRRSEGRTPADSWLVVVADPVYGRDDPRLPQGTGNENAGHEGAGSGSSSEPWRRLTFTGEEAKALAHRLPADKTTVLTGFGASRKSITGGALRGHRLLHFATHGVLNPQHPLLSRLVLSTWSDIGRPVEGDLRAHEIYDLDLPAELVVLSACDTGVGLSVRGEGLQAGLPRAFLYAGAKRVMVSLWPVRDRHTGKLMERFYDGLFTRDLPPSRALREAQLAAWHEGLPPSAWAGFLLYGETEPLPPFL